MNWKNLISHLDVQSQCRKYRVGLWECPQFLFLIMGIIIIISILLTYAVTSLFAEPEFIIIIVSTLTAALFVVGNLVVSAFDRVARFALSKSEFISIMSHQLRSPLAAIKWQLDAVLSPGLNAEIFQEKTRYYLEAVDNQNERMIRVVNDLLDVNRIEDNDFLLRPTAWSLAALSKKIIDRYKTYASANNVRVSLFAQSEEPPVFADEEHIRRVIEHLLDNAIRYSVRGGDVSLAIERSGPDKMLWKITDEGAGISKEDQPRIFEKFFRASSAIRHQTDGSGIGLFIAKSIIKRSGGNIGFSSVQNKGSTFWFSLPINRINTTQ